MYTSIRLTHLLMDEANDPPPTPEMRAHAIKVLKLQFGSAKTIPAMIMECRGAKRWSRPRYDHQLLE